MTAPVRMVRNQQELYGSEAQEFVRELPPQQITPKPELRQFEGELGLRQAEPGQVPGLRRELDEFAEKQRRALELAEQGGDPRTVRTAFSDADALMQTQVLAGLDGITTQEAMAKAKQTSEARTPVVEQASVVSPVRPEASHHVTAETLRVPTHERTAEQRLVDEQLGGFRTEVAAAANIQQTGAAVGDVRSEAARIAGMLNTQDATQLAQGTEALRSLLQRSNLTLADLRDMGVEIPRGVDGAPIISAETLRMPAEQAEGAAGRQPPGTAPEVAGKSTVSTTGSVLAGSRTAKAATLGQMQAGYGGLEQRLEVEAEQLRLQEAEFEKLRRELEDRMRGIQSNVNASVLQQNPELRAGLAEIVKSADMQPTDENALKALQTATLIADVQLEPEKMKAGGLGRSLAGVMQNDEFREQASTFMRVQNDVQSDVQKAGGNVDMPTVVAAARAYNPQSEEELRRILREIKERELKNLDLKQELATPDVRRNQPDAFRQMGEILDGADTTK